MSEDGSVVLAEEAIQAEIENDGLENIYVPNSSPQNHENALLAKITQYESAFNVIIVIESLVKSGNRYNFTFKIISADQSFSLLSGTATFTTTLPS